MKLKEGAIYWKYKNGALITTIEIVSKGKNKKIKTWWVRITNTRGEPRETWMLHSTIVENITEKVWIPANVPVH